MKKYTMLCGLEVAYDTTPAINQYIDEVRRLVDDSTTTEDQIVATVYSVENPLMDKAAIPGRGAVTTTVLGDPAYRVMTDLIFRKHVAARKVDIEALAVRYTLGAADAAARLGVTRSAIHQAIDSGRIGAWVKDGHRFIDPAALATFPLKPRGAKPKPAADAPPAPPRASIDPLQIRAGASGGAALYASYPGEWLPKLQGVSKGSAGQVSPWRRVGVLTVSADGRSRFFVIEPAADESKIELGSFFVRGRFAITRKENNSKRANEAWSAFEAA